jgi:8-oxo-dGTP diphosphatase
VTDSAPAPEFGEREAGAAYVDRPGAYAIVLDASALLLVVRVDGRLFLPGGGIEARESEEEALVREVLEETGCLVRVRARVGSAAQYARSRSGRRHYRKIEHFHAADLVGVVGGAIEADHETIWLPPRDVVLSEAAQRWALERALGG